MSRLVSGWANAPSGDLSWHAFVADEDGTEPVRSRCGGAELPAAGIADLERVPLGRPCLACLLAATEELPQVGRMGTMS